MSAPAAVPPGSAGRRARPQAAQRWVRRASTALAMAALGVAIVVHRDTVAEGLSLARSVSAVSLMPLVAAWLFLSGCRAWTVAISLRGLGIGRALFVTESVAGLENALPGGIVLAQGLRVAMCTSWGADLGMIALSMLATGTVTVVCYWALPMLAVIPRIIDGAAGWVEVIVLATGMALISTVTLLWIGMLRSSRRVDRLAGWLTRWASQLADRFPALMPTDHDIDLDLFRRRARILWRRRAVGLLLTDAGYQVGLFLLFLSAVDAVGAGTVSAPDAVRAFALVRVATWLIPVPGGLGAVDAGLAVALVAAGAEQPSAVATVVLFRTFSYVAPMVTGLVAVVGWRIDPRLRSGDRL